MQVHLKSGVDSIELTATGDGKTGVSFAVSSEEEEEKEEWRGGAREDPWGFGGRMRGRGWRVTRGYRHGVGA
jgi:hypothetical protein